MLISIPRVIVLCVLACVSALLSGCDHPISGAKNIHARMTISGKWCPDLITKNVPADWEGERTWRLCMRTNKILNPSVIFWKNGNEDWFLNFSWIYNGNFKTKGFYCNLILATPAGQHLYDPAHREYAEAWPIILQSHRDYCQNALSRRINSKFSELESEHKESVKFKNTVGLIILLILGGVILFIVWRIVSFLNRKKEAIYGALVPHPAEKSVDIALKSGGRVVTPELKNALMKTHELVDNPPASWKTKVMAEKADALTARIQKERQLAREAIELERARKLAELEKKYGPEK